MSQFVRLTVPVVGAFLAAALCLFVSELPGPPTLEVNLVVVLIPVPLKNPVVAKSVLASVAAILFAFVACRDYAPFFPTSLRFRVYYDEDGLAKAVSCIRRADQAIPLLPDWRDARRKYFTEFDTIIHKKLPDYGPFFSVEAVGSHLRGEALGTYGVEYVGFWQRYRISEISGKVTHFLTPPHVPQEELETRYTLHDTAYNVIEPSLRQYLRTVIVVRPIMQQSLMAHGQRVYEARIVGVTRIRFFPFVRFDRTVFCAESDAGLVPIGYALYFPIA